MPSLSWESRWRMMLRWSSRTPRSSSSLSSVSVTSSVGLMSSSPVWCYDNNKKTENSMLFTGLTYRDKQPFMVTFTTRADFRVINLTYMSLGGS